MKQRQYSTIFLLLTNVLTIGYAVYEHWSLANVMWLFWFQSIIIGMFQAKKMLDLKQFSTKGMTYNNESVPETLASKKKMVFFFLFHYGFFHVMYLIFLLGKFEAFPEKTVYVGVCAFFVNHLYSYLVHRAEASEKIRHLGHMMVFPYFRVLPIHLSFVFAPGVGTLSLISFLLLKTGADVGMHLVEHKI